MSRITASSLRRNALPGQLKHVARPFDRMLPGEFSDRIQSLIARDDLDDHLERNEADGVALAHSCARLVEAAFVRREPTALYEAQKALYFLYEDSLKPAVTRIR